MSLPVHGEVVISRSTGVLFVTAAREKGHPLARAKASTQQPHHRQPQRDPRLEKEPLVMRLPATVCRIRQMLFSSWRTLLAAMTVLSKKTKPDICPSMRFQAQAKTSVHLLRGMRLELHVHPELCSNQLRIMPFSRMAA